MKTRWLTVLVLAGVLAGCAHESRYDRYARIAREANAASPARVQAAPAAESAARTEIAAERQRVAEAERAREAAERKAREAEKAAEEARKAQARAEAKAKAQADAKAARAAEMAAAAQAREDAKRAAEEARAAREELARQKREAARVAASGTPAAGTEPEMDSADSPVKVVSPGQDADANGYISYSVGGIVLKPQDVVTVVLRGIPAPEQIEDQIDDEGNISLPLLGEVRAAGYNATDLEREIRRQYIDRKIYQNINVTVIVPSRFYFIQGEVRGPGRYQLVQAIHLSQAIAQAGGYTEFAKKSAIITRDGKIFTKVNTKKLASHPEDDLLLEPGDIVEIERSFW